MELFEKFYDFDGDGKLNVIETAFLLDEIERIEEEAEAPAVFSDYWEDEEDDWDDIDPDDLDIDDLCI